MIFPKWFLYCVICIRRVGFSTTTLQDGEIIMCARCVDKIIETNKKLEKLDKKSIILI